MSEGVGSRFNFLDRDEKQICCRYHTSWRTKLGARRCREGVTLRIIGDALSHDVWVVLIDRWCKAYYWLIFNAWTIWSMAINLFNLCVWYGCLCVQVSRIKNYAFYILLILFNINYINTSIMFNIEINFAQYNLVQELIRVKPQIPWWIFIFRSYIHCAKKLFFFSGWSLYKNSFFHLVIESNFYIMKFLFTIF